MSPKRATPGPALALDSPVVAISVSMQFKPFLISFIEASGENNLRSASDACVKQCEVQWSLLSTVETIQYSGGLTLSTVEAVQYSGGVTFVPEKLNGNKQRLASFSSLAFLNSGRLSSSVTQIQAGSIKTFKDPRKLSKEVPGLIDFLDGAFNPSSFE